MCSKKLPSDPFEWSSSEQMLLIFGLRLLSPAEIASFAWSFASQAPPMKVQQMTMKEKVVRYQLAVVAAVLGVVYMVCQMKKNVEMVVDVVVVEQNYLTTSSLDDFSNQDCICWRKDHNFVAVVDGVCCCKCWLHRLQVVVHGLQMLTKKDTNQHNDHQKSIFHKVWQLKVWTSDSWQVE